MENSIKMQDNIIKHGATVTSLSDLALNLTILKSAITSPKPIAFLHKRQKATKNLLIHPNLYPNMLTIVRFNKKTFQIIQWPKIRENLQLKLIFILLLIG